MVAQNTVWTWGINQLFWFVKGIWLHKKSRQIRFFNVKVRNKFWATILYKDHEHLPFVYYPVHCCLLDLVYTAYLIAQLLLLFLLSVCMYVNLLNLPFYLMSSLFFLFATIIVVCLYVCKSFISPILSLSLSYSPKLNNLFSFL